MGNTELEKQFFDTFVIEPKCETRAEYRKHECYGMVDCDECASAIYPQITDKHYLELICILSSFEKEAECCYLIVAEDIEELKKHILLDCIEYGKHVRTEVQALFKEK